MTTSITDFDIHGKRYIQYSDGEAIEYVSEAGVSAL